VAAAKRETQVYRVREDEEHATCGKSKSCAYVKCVYLDTSKYVDKMCFVRTIENMGPLPIAFSGYLWRMNLNFISKALEFYC
jgi:hypothetical protein